MKIQIPEFCLVALVGASGSGKSTFAQKHFKSSEVLSSDFCRAMVSDDENDQSATNDAFDVLYYIAGKRLSAGKLTVIDATNVQDDARKHIVALAKEHDCLPTAIVLDIPERVCRERNTDRANRQFGDHVIPRQRQQLRKALKTLEREGFRYVYVLSSEEEIEQTTIELQPLWTNKKHEHGPFDIIGDIHGCYDELTELLEKLGYSIRSTDDELTVSTSHNRKVIFLGDLVDRGPKTPAVLRLVMNMVENNLALCVPGNHDIKLMRKLNGRDVKITHGLAESLEQLEAEPVEFKARVAKWVDKLISHFVLDDGRLVVAHAGMKAKYQGRSSRRVREFALYGETTGETDDYGLPVRYNWANEYRGDAMVVYGHTPTLQPEWVNRTMCVDTGCVFGGKLSALRYPEREIVSVPARAIYYESAKPFLNEEIQAQIGIETSPSSEDNMIDINDVMGKRIVETSLIRQITIREENAVAALEVMSRFAVNPKWIIYLPPTMSPCETSKLPGLLEHPAEAFNYFKLNGVESAVCEEKHMGSRAVVIVARDEHTLLKRFGIADEGCGVCYTRTGRPFFRDENLQIEFITQIQSAISRANLWEELNSDWFLLDCELMPWSAKAQELLSNQYAAVGAAARSVLAESMSLLTETSQRGLDVATLTEHFRQRQSSADLYADAYGRYCWPVNSLSDYKLAPFHLLASENNVHINKSHEWHMQILGRLADAGDGLIIKTSHQIVDLANEAEVQAGVSWWERLTNSGGEGLVIKPIDFVVRGAKGLVQPAVKCRGKEYLRIIYGPEYDHEEYLERLRHRGLGGKRSLALREFALGIEALERFVKHEPLYRVHQCVFGVLALESEPVDPRL